ncbi:hypothetical protein [Thalassotalea sp. PS06]|uniref:hypothetical protein n=1 Tax=Thalassotalea sp. PS06 TaxID=2594005 RepID=UPI001C8F35C9|nr:hypothetical protein [Thalassotalea sp. PS06]
MTQANASAPDFHHKNPTHKETLLKFLALVALLVGYFIYMSMKYDASTGFGLAILSWSFFVLCTPVADGGFILAFPIRLLKWQPLRWSYGLWQSPLIFTFYRLMPKPTS